MRTRPSRAWDRMASCLWRPEFGGTRWWWRLPPTFRWRSVTGAALVVGLLALSADFVRMWAEPHWAERVPLLAGVWLPMWFVLVYRWGWRRVSARATVRALRRADTPWVTGDRVYRLSRQGLLRGTLATSNWALAAAIAFAGSLTVSTIGKGNFQAQMIMMLAAAAMAAIGWVTTNRWTERFVGRAQRGVCASCGYDDKTHGARCSECGEPKWFGRRLVKARGQAGSDPHTGSAVVAG